MAEDVSGIVNTAKFGEIVGQVRGAGWFIEDAAGIGHGAVNIEFVPLEAATTEGDDKIHITYQGLLVSRLLTAFVDVLPDLLPRDINRLAP